MHLRRVDLSKDLELLQEFFFEVFDSEAAAEIWQWKYSPAWSPEVYAWIGFDSGKVALHTGAVHLRGMVNGEDIPFFQFGDIALHPRNRGAKTLAYANTVTNRVLRSVSEDHPQHVYYGFTGRRTALLYRHKGGKVIEEACDRLHLVEPGAELDVNLELRVLDWDASEIDELWDSMPPATGIIRDRMYLNWRYVQHPLYSYRLIGIYREGVLTGWLVLTEDGFDGESREEVRVQDHLMPNELFASVLDHVANMYQARVVVFWLPERLWKGKSRKTNWVVLCMSHLAGYSTQQMADELHYGLGEADQWWW